jgi:adenylate/guanylate cyclase family protein
VKDFQSSLITPTTQRNHGRVVKWTGDGFIATFDSAVNAVRAAIEIQSGVAAAGASAADDRRIYFRIGINTGDVINVPGDVYGDTVNVAARLQVLAEPGGISISTGVRDAVRGKFSLEFENRGELNVRNIPDPVGTFNVIFDPDRLDDGPRRDAVGAPHQTQPQSASRGGRIARRGGCRRHLVFFGFITSFAGSFLVAAGLVGAYGVSRAGSGRQRFGERGAGV